VKKFLGLLSMVAVAVLSWTVVAAAQPRVGDVMGDVLHTDIRVLIDDVPLASYNLGGTTYVVATHLRAHGFEVHWDENTRRVDIVRGASSEQPRSVPVNTQPIGSVAFPFFYTDIVTYVEGQRVSSFNIGGSTVVRIAQVAAAAGVDLEWSDSLRRVIVSTMSFEYEVFRLLNAYRQQNGLAVIAWHEGLAAVSSLHAQDFLGTTSASNTGTDGSSMQQGVQRAGLEMVHVNGFTARRAEATPQALFDWLLSNNARRNAVLSDFVQHGALHIGSTTQPNGTVMRFVVFKTAAPLISDPAQFERQVFELINQERASRGLQPLVVNIELANLARLRTQNQINTTGSQDLRASQHSEAFTNNISPEFYVSQFVNSPNAHLNILHPNARSVGIGMNLSSAALEDRMRVDLAIFFQTADGQIPVAANPNSVANLQLFGLLPQSNITLPTQRVTSPAERSAWIAEYRAMGGPSAFEMEVVRLVNEYRTSIGLSYLIFDPTLAMAARYYTQLIIHIGYTTADMIPNVSTAHNQGPHGTSVATARSFGANITWGGNAFVPGPFENTPQSVVDGWLRSAGHYRYIVSPTHRYIGAGMSLRDDNRTFSYLFMSPNPSVPNY